MLYEMTNNKNEFQLPHPVRGATVTSDGHALAGGISTPAPCEGCDRKDRSMQFSTSISTPAPCEGCDSHKFDTLRKKWQFQLPHPVRGATLRSFSICSFLFQLPHPVRGATNTLSLVCQSLTISTPAPCEGCDVVCFFMERPTANNFNSRTL